MAKTSKKQIGFYADPEVAEYLGSLESGIKTKKINEVLKQAIRAEKHSRVNYPCNSCDRFVSGTVTHLYEDPDFEVNDFDQLMEVGENDFVLARCPHKDCQQTTLMEKIAIEDIGFRYRRLYPEPDTPSELYGDLQHSMEKAYAAYYNRDYNAVALYCRRLLEAWSKRIGKQEDTKQGSISKRLSELVTEKRLDECVHRWAKKILDDSNMIIHDVGVDLDKSDAKYILLFLKEVLRSSLILHEKEKEYDEIRKKRPKRRQIEHLQ